MRSVSVLPSKQRIVIAMKCIVERSAALHIQYLKVTLEAFTVVLHVTPLFPAECWHTTQNHTLGDVLLS